MEDASPPYPGPESQHGNIQPLPVKIISSYPSNPEGPDLKANCHIHRILIAITDGDTPPFSSILHHWPLPHSQSSPARAILTNLKPSSLQLIRGFRDLGTHQIPVEPATSVVDRHKYLSSLIEADCNDHRDPSASDEETLISRLIERLDCQSGSQSEGRFIQMFTIPVLSDRPDSLWTDGQAPVWKWIKPESSYGVTSGFWEIGLERAITDGEWRAGKELQLLVRGVSEQVREELTTGRVMKSARA